MLLCKTRLLLKPHSTSMQQQPQPITTPLFSFGQQNVQAARRTAPAGEIKGASTQATGTTPAAQSRTSKPKTTNLVARHAAGLVLRRHLLLLLQHASLACPATSGSNNPTQHTCIPCAHLQQLAQGCTRISRNHKRMRGGGEEARVKRARAGRSSFQLRTRWFSSQS